jgi:BirA family biotin operon repressor/biotin-[acetyl-CoA-carboxylase] ligase
VNPVDTEITALDARQISLLMSPVARQQLLKLSVLEETDSSNSALQRIPLQEQHAHAILAEQQTQGRGRRERSWYSPPGCNVYLSLGWQFPKGKLPLSLLPLVAAVCTCRALSRSGLQGHGIKWPNDILVSGAKLAGILVEMQASSQGPAHAVIGVGINVSMRQADEPHQQAESTIDRRWTDLDSQMPENSEGISRNSLVAALLEELLAGLSEYQNSVFHSFAGEWAELDLLRGNTIRLQLQATSTVGIARGISDDGGLLLEVVRSDGQADTCVFHAGEVSVDNE